MPIIKGHEGTKYCPKCDPLHERPPKPLSDFPRNRNRSDGHGAYCKQCSKLINHNSYRKVRVEWNEKRRMRRVEKAMQSELIPSKKPERNHWNHCTCSACRDARQQARLEAARRTLQALQPAASD
jgi:ribosomal protein L44E